MAYEYTDELGESIAERLVTHTLSEICESDKTLPSRDVIERWMRKHESFAAICARARELHAHYLIEQAELTAKACDEDNANAAKVKIGFAQWFAARVVSKTYGDRISQEHSGPEGGPIKAEISVKFVKPEE